MDRIAGLERKLKRVMKDVNRIQKELILTKAASRKHNKKKRDATAAWETLARRVSSRWKGPHNAVAEIRWQREKP